MTTRKRIFAAIIFLIQICLVWPVYPLVSDIYPLILGLPLSFAWVVGLLVVSFLTMLWYYHTDPGMKAVRDPGPGPESDSNESPPNENRI